MAGEPEPALSAVSVANGGAVTVPQTPGPMYSELTSSGDITNVSVTLTGANAGDVIKVNGTTVTSGTAFIHDFKNDGATLTIVVSNPGAVDPTATANYTLTVYDGVQETKMSTIQHVGWFGARCISGDLDAYDGGLTLALGNFKPKFVISVQVSNGFTGYFDIPTGKLKVYKAPNTEANASELSTSKYSVILME